MPDPSAPPSHGPGTGAARLEVRLLGPFEVALAGRTVHIGSPKQRAVLAALALQAGKLVTSDTLCEVVWDDDQPASPSATLQSLISRLRGTLAGASEGLAETARDVLHTREPGWVLEVEPAAVDALRFQELTGRARRYGSRDAGAALEHLNEAVGLWRGAALVDIVEAGYLAGLRPGSTSPARTPSRTWPRPNWPSGARPKLSLNSRRTSMPTRCESGAGAS